MVAQANKTGTGKKNTIRQMKKIKK